MMFAGATCQNCGMPYPAHTNHTCVGKLVIGANVEAAPLPIDWEAAARRTEARRQNPDPQSDKERRWAAAQAWQAEHAVPDPQSDIERYRAQMAPLLAELVEMKRQNGMLRASWRVNGLLWGFSDKDIDAVLKSVGPNPPPPPPFGAKEPAEELADLRAELANARGWLLWIEQTHPGLTAMWRRGDAAP